MRTVLLVLATIILTGCLQPEARPTPAKQVQDYMKALSFMKHTNGLCFGILSVEKMSTGGYLSMSVAITEVPCEKVGL